MTLGERGLFHTLRLECWVNGKFHSDHRLLAAMLNIPEASIEKAFTPLVQRKFKRVGDCFVSEELRTTEKSYWIGMAVLLQVAQWVEGVPNRITERIGTEFKGGLSL